MMQKINPFRLLLVLIISLLGTPTGSIYSLEDSKCPENWKINEETGQCTYDIDDNDDEISSYHDAAHEMCEAVKSQLVPMFSVKKQSLVFSLILRKGPKCKIEKNCMEYWISIVESKGDDSAEKVKFWDPNFHNGKGPCVVIRIEPDKKAKTGSWKVENCKKTLRDICSTQGDSTKRPGHRTTTPPATTSVPTIQRTRSIPHYKVIPKQMHWEDAYAECVEYGRMAFIINSDENDALFRHIEGLPDDIAAKCLDPVNSKFYGWVGGKRHTCSEPFDWMNSAGGENWPIDYFNWREGEPNCLYSMEHCLAVTRMKDDVKWKDESCKVAHCPICEKLVT